MPAPTLTMASTGGAMPASHHNEVTKFLQPGAGDTVTGNFDITFNSTVAGQVFGFWLPFFQRSVPASFAPSTTGLPASVTYGGTNNLSASGVEIFYNVVSASANIGITGTYTVSY